MIICSFYNTVEEKNWYADVSRDIAEYRLKQCDKVVLSLSYLASTHNVINPPIHAYFHSSTIKKPKKIKYIIYITFQSWTYQKTKT